MTQMGPETAEDLEPIEGLLGVPFPQVFDFVEDAAIGASIGEDGAWVGVAGEVTDEEVASDRLQRVLGIVGAMASRDDAGIEVTEADVDGTTVTTITLPEEATEDMQVGGMPFAVESVSIADRRWHAAVRHGRLRDGRARLRRQRLARLERGLHVGRRRRRPRTSASCTPTSAGLMTTLDPLLSFVMDDWDDVVAVGRWRSTGSSRSARADDSVISARLTLYVD